MLPIQPYPREVGMDMHKNAPSTPPGRAEPVRLGAVRKWVGRDDAEARAGLLDRPCRPRRSLNGLRDFSIIDGTRHPNSIAVIKSRRCRKASNVIDPVS